MVAKLHCTALHCTPAAMDLPLDGSFLPQYSNFFDDQFPTTVNPEDLHHSSASTSALLLEDLEISSGNSNSHFYHDMNPHDSGVDLRAQWSSSLKQADSFDSFLNMDDESPVAQNTPSPATDMIFSNTNSPGDFIPDHSSVSSPEAAPTAVKHEAEGGDVWNTTYADDAILIPQSRDVPRVHLSQDKSKTRAETQIKMSLFLDPLDNIDFIRFPRKTLAKPKHFASDEEKLEVEAKGTVLDMDVHLVCAMAVESPEDCARAKRRAAGTEALPRRPEGVTIAELDKDDPAHPQNGGEVLICDGCKERERKRYDRKKKRGEDEEEFTKYESDRVIMINEKEHKKLKDVDASDSQFSPRARQVDFAMRIACYCRHQEEKSPQGYRVIFTFTLGNTLLVQHVSDVFHITDDHKNKDLSAEAIPQRITIPQGFGMHYPHHSNVVVPLYQYPENYAASMGTYSQPPTPIASSQFTSPISPIDSAFSQSLPPTMPQSMPQSMAHSMAQSMPPSMPTLSMQARQPASTTFAPSASTNMVSFNRHARGQSYYDQPSLMSPASQMAFEAQALPRPQSMDNFNFSFPHNDTQFGHSQQTQYFSSAPPSAGGTPLNLSRPASPTWEQGLAKKGKTIRCVYFHVDE